MWEEGKRAGVREDDETEGYRCTQDPRKAAASTGQKRQGIDCLLEPPEGMQFYVLDAEDPFQISDR